MYLQAVRAEDPYLKRQRQPVQNLTQHLITHAVRNVFYVIVTSIYPFGSKIENHSMCDL